MGGGSHECFHRGVKFIWNVSYCTIALASNKWLSRRAREGRVRGAGGAHPYLCNPLYMSLTEPPPQYSMHIHMTFAAAESERV
jgi:hypothetical protein